jgi:hypothetical protein
MVLPLNALVTGGIIFLRLRGCQPPSVLARLRDSLRRNKVRSKDRIPLFLAVFSGVLVAGAVMSSKEARADQWGCEVLLCMSNPAGPTAVSQCVTPMERFYSVLKHSGSRPTCPESGWSGNIGYQPLTCPDGFDLTRSDVGQGLQPVCESATGATRPVEQRSQPYYADIPQANGQPGLQRIWLSEH